MTAFATIRAAYDEPAIRTRLLTEIADAIRRQLPDAPSGRLSDLALRALDARLVARDPESEIVADLRQQYSTDWTTRALLAVAQERTVAEAACRAAITTQLADVPDTTRRSSRLEDMQVACDLLQAVPAGGDARAAAHAAHDAGIDDLCATYGVATVRAAVDGLYAQAVDDEDGGLPYPWCRQPEQCRGRGSCPRDPTCGE
ncbi:MAG: hypothetical protein KJ018_14730 [Burkholderiales bacterium]|nr:hypothetical protein [Burkholderiales bacterium]